VRKSEPQRPGGGGGAVGRPKNHLGRSRRGRTLPRYSPNVFGFATDPLDLLSNRGVRGRFQPILKLRGQINTIEGPPISLCNRLSPLDAGRDKFVSQSFVCHTLIVAHTSACARPQMDARDAPDARVILAEMGGAAQASEAPSLQLPRWGLSLRDTTSQSSRILKAATVRQQTSAGQTHLAETGHR